MSRHRRQQPIEGAAGKYYKVMITTSGGLDLFRFLYDRAIRNLRRIESILAGERDPVQMPTLYKKTADILNYLLLLFQEQMDDPEYVAQLGDQVDTFIQLHKDLLESITDFAWDMDRDRVMFCREVLTHMRRQLGHPQLRIPRHEAMMNAPPVETPEMRPLAPAPVSGIRSAAQAVEGHPPPG